MEYDFRTFQFSAGAHRTRYDGMCIMEAVAYVAGEPHSDQPACACPVIASFLRVMNDRITDDLRTPLLAEFVYRLVGTKSTVEIERRRAFMAADFAVRVALPHALRVVGKPELAVKLESLPEIVDAETEVAAHKVACEAHHAASAADFAALAALAALMADCAASPAGAADFASGAVHHAADAAYFAGGAVHYAAEAAYYAGDAAGGNDVWRKAAALVNRMIRLTEPLTTLE